MQLLTQHGLGGRSSECKYTCRFTYSIVYTLFALLANVKCTTLVHLAFSLFMLTSQLLILRN